MLLTNQIQISMQVYLEALMGTLQIFPIFLIFLLLIDFLLLRAILQLILI